MGEFLEALLRMKMNARTVDAVQILHVALATQKEVDRLRSAINSIGQFLNGGVAFDTSPAKSPVASAKVRAIEGTDPQRCALMQSSESQCPAQNGAAKAKEEVTELGQTNGQRIEAGKSQNAKKDASPKA